MTKVEYLDMSTVDEIVFTVCHEYSDCSYKEMEKKSRPTVNEFYFNQCTVIVTIYFTDYLIFVPLGG